MSGLSPSEGLRASANGLEKVLLLLTQEAVEGHNVFRFCRVDQVPCNPDSIHDHRKLSTNPNPLSFPCGHRAS